MRLRHLVPCATAIVALALPAAPANAAAKKRCSAREGVFVQYQVLRGSSRGVSCSSTFSVLFKGILNQRTPSGWRCRHPRAAAWPVVETCERRVRGRRTVVAELRATDDFFTKE
jgi:hypothetical protein